MNEIEGSAARGHRLANDRYHLVIADDGTGSSHFGALAITRHTPDATRETDAFVLYVRDIDSGEYWSAAAEPVRHHDDPYEVIAHDGIVTFVREHDGIRTTLEVTLVPNAPAEERRLTIENLSDRERHIDVTTYAELVLNTPVADAAHPAFSKLFVETEWDAGREALIARRRLRAADDEPMWVVHTLRAVGGGTTVGWETDRMRFIGRGRTTARPRALDADAELSGTTGGVLDPVFSLRRGVAVAPGASVQMIALLGAGHTREEVVSIVAQRGAAVATKVAARTPAVGASAGLLAADRYRPAAAPATTIAANSDEELRFFNGFGGFSADGTEYVIRLDATPSGVRWPPMPWSNVIANESAGCIVTAGGAVTSWSANSRENRLTPWFNDPVSDPFGEAIYLRDEESGTFWSPLPGPTPAPAPYEARHGFGYTSWYHTSHDLEQSTITFLPRHDPVKIVRLRLRNTSARPRRITVTSYAHLVLGGVPWITAPTVSTSRDETTGAMLATNPSRGEFGERTAFATLVAPASAGAGAVSATGDRTAFLGRTGSVADPAALHSDAPLDGRTGVGLDPCAAFRCTVTIPAGEDIELAFLLGEAESETRARSLLLGYADLGAIASALDDVRDFWRDMLGGVQIETPSPALDLMVNGWLAYQNLSCRVWGRSAYYQSGGAFGFRDQLQDSAALLYLDPSITRAQILLHAAHQFIEGDVMHWWHPPTSKGIRTRFSDDLLWLPYITAFYVARTGDKGVLDAEAPYVTGPELESEEDERFMVPVDSGFVGSVYEHCCLAIDRSLTSGAHGIPLMGSGDWNDGMNRVGREGRGESVWLGFFLFAILGDFIPIAESRGDEERVVRYLEFRDRLGDALNDAGWDGGWYRRAFYDDGTPLGTTSGDECRIDAIAQAWSVLSGAAPAERAEIALDAAEQHLVREEEKLIRLLTPPFDRTTHDPGYIKGYLPGVRENGGQYTHGVLWVVRALAELGRTERATKLLEMLSPVTHGRTPEEVDVYRVEPYVIAADVYGVAPHVGRGGWTWYTGSAGWMYRVALESLLGLTIVGGTRLELRPCVPESWPGFSVRMRLPDGRTRYEIVLTRAGADTSATQVHVDGELVVDAVDDGAASIELVRDGSVHLIEIALAGDLTPRYASASAAP